MEQGKGSTCIGYKDHNFEPRYDEHPINTLFRDINCGVPIEEFRKLFLYKVYVCDICTKCGAIVKRNDS